MSEHLLADISKKLKKIRKEKGLRVFEVAERAGVTNGLISKIENGRTIPSLPVLISIVRALDVNMDNFFNGMSYEPEKKFIHKKAGTTTTIEKEDESIGFDYQFILNKSFSSFTMESVILTIDPNSKRELVSTDAWEYKYLIEGEIRYQIEDQFIHLEKGDTLFYNANQLHVPHNDTDKPAVMLVIYFFQSGNEF